MKQGPRFCDAPATENRGQEVSLSLESELGPGGGTCEARSSEARPPCPVLCGSEHGVRSGARAPGLVASPQGALLFKGRGCSRPGRSLQVESTSSCLRHPKLVNLPTGDGIMGQTRHLHYMLSNSRVTGAVSTVRKVAVFQVLVTATDLGNGAWGPLGNGLAQLLCYRPVSELLVGSELHPRL